MRVVFLQDESLSWGTKELKYGSVMGLLCNYGRGGEGWLEGTKKVRGVSKQVPNWWEAGPFLKAGPC